jgi:hypothetical protein
MNVWRTSLVVQLCSFWQNSPAGYAPPSHSDNDDIPPLEEVAQDQQQPQPVQPPPPQPPPRPQPEQEPEYQSISVDKILANFGLVLNLQLIPEDERDTDTGAVVRREAAAASAAAADCLARTEFLNIPEELTPAQLISLLHCYPEAAVAACVERMRRPHNLRQIPGTKIVGTPSHPFSGQTVSSPGRPAIISSGQHIPLETTLPLPSLETPLSPTSPQLSPISTPPQLPPPALSLPQIRMLPVPLPPRPVAAQRAPLEPVSASTTRYRHGIPFYPEAETFYNPFDAVTPLPLPLLCYTKPNYALSSDFYSRLAQQQQQHIKGSQPEFIFLFF